MKIDKPNFTSSGFIESFDSRYPTCIFETLLKDRTTGRNIIWADDEYEALGDGYMGDDEITIEKITGLSSGVIKPRIAKEQEHQSKRTRTRAEVFTPSWLCNRMNNDIDAIWFGKRDVFNVENGLTWLSNPEPIAFPKRKGHGWHAYVESPYLEVTCGEAPFVCSRYDTVTGDKLPVGERVGFLDRKLRVVTEKTKTRKEWVRCALDALRATYGFEYQGDNLLIARINVFETFCEYLSTYWEAGISNEEMDQAAWIVSWNFWQMDGLTDAVPTNKTDAVVQSSLFEYEEPVPEPLQPSLFDLLDEPFFENTSEENKKEGSDKTVPLCVIYDWQNGGPFEFASLKGKASNMEKKFYAVIGNPPYQEEAHGSNNSDTPIYHFFYEESFSISDKVELITPARFLFNAGGTPADWNKKMLSDEHLKVEKYESNSSKVFPDTSISGGLAILYRDADRAIGPIGVFTPYDELNRIVKKVCCKTEASLSSVVTNRGMYRYSDLVYKEHPEEMLGASDRRIAPSCFERMPSLFTANKPNDGEEYIEIYGNLHGERVTRWFRKDYVKPVGNLNCFKAVISKADGAAGQIGHPIPARISGKPIVLNPGVGFTETFISIGESRTRAEADNTCKYVKTKFARAMLGVLKVTQNNAKPTWAKVPLQDFTSSSDIDWSRSVPEIDEQLYVKYGLSDEEIDFIESYVKEME